MRLKKATAIADPQTDRKPILPLDSDLDDFQNSKVKEVEEEADDYS
jgi:hypothetical protein